MSSTDEHGNLSDIAIEIFSYKLSLTELRVVVDKIVADYKIKKQNKLGNQLYYFNESIQPIGMTNTGRLDYTNAKKNLFFSMTPFHTNKKLNNIFGDQIDLLTRRLDFFINNKNWYASKGIPYTFGVLLHGDPGCGKTSMIKAISNLTQRHIINLSLHAFTTKTQLHNLFYDSKIVVQKGGDQLYETYTIPCDKRVYILEDVDCMTDIVLDRSTKKSIEPNFEICGNVEDEKRLSNVTPGSVEPGAIEEYSEGL